MTQEMRRHQLFQTLEKQGNNNRFLAQKMREKQTGMVEMIPDKGDQLSFEEQNKDPNIIKREFDKKVYQLFRNDSGFSEKFIFLAESISSFNYFLFNAIFPQLLSLYGNSRSPPDMVMQTALQLMITFQKTGSINSTSGQINLSKLTPLLKGNASKIKDSIDKMEAIVDLGKFLSNIKINEITDTKLEEMKVPGQKSHYIAAFKRMSHYFEELMQLSLDTMKPNNEKASHLQRILDGIKTETFDTVIQYRSRQFGLKEKKESIEEYKLSKSPSKKQARSLKYNTIEE